VAPFSAVGRPSTASAPQRAAGTCRDSRRAARGRREDWVRPFLRAHHALDASLRLIRSSIRTAAVSDRLCQRPLDTSLKLHHATDLLMTASARLQRAVKGLGEANARAARHPERAAAAPALLIEAAARFVQVAGTLQVVAGQVFELHTEVLDGIKAGELVPEPPPAPRRPRIVLTPRPAPVRAFLRARQPRVVDRISPLLQRRRRTRRPAALTVPQRTSQGRAPPLFPVCLL
jgi:hypothetical protein